MTAGGVGASGKIAIFLMRKLGQIKIATAQVTAEKSFSDPKGAFLFPRIKDNAAIGMAWRSASTPTTPPSTAACIGLTAQTPPKR